MIRKAGEPGRVRRSVKQFLVYYLPVWILLIVALSFFISGKGLEIISADKWDEISGMKMDDMGGVTWMTWVPVLIVGYAVGGILQLAAPAVAVIAGVVFAVMTVVHFYRKNKT